MGITSAADPRLINLTGNDYLLGKFQKHTIVPTGHELTSIFSVPSYANYQNRTIQIVDNGFLEIDNRQRYNFLFDFGTNVGTTFLNGNVHCLDSFGKVVLPFATGRMHSYPLSSAVLQGISCSNCHRRI